METDPKQKIEDEEIHNPAEAGRKAIKAEKLTNDKDKPKEQQEDEEKADAEKWRNEG